MRRQGKQCEAGLGGASLSNSNGLWGEGTVLIFLVPGPGVIS